MEENKTREIRITLPSTENQMSQDQILGVVETIEEQGMEDLCVALNHVVCHADMKQIPVDERERVHKFIYGLFTVAHAN